jgi:nucleoid DNA-binding protein
MARLNPKPSRSETGLFKTKYDIIKSASKMTGMSQYDVQRVFESCLVSIMRLAATSEPGTKIMIRGFGTFTVCEFSEQVRNMSGINGKMIRTPSRRRIVFRPHKQFNTPLLKDAEFFTEDKVFTGR